MLGIIFLVLLCVANNKNAKARNHSGGGAVAYTLALWFGFGIAGFFISFAAQYRGLEEYFAFGYYRYAYNYLDEDAVIMRFLGLLVLGYILGVIAGGLVSFFISRRGEPVNVIPVGAMYNPAPGYYNPQGPYGQPGYPAQPAYGQPQQPGYGQPPSQPPAYGQPPQGVPPYGYTQPTPQPYGQPAAPPQPAQPAPAAFSQPEVDASPAGQAPAGVAMAEPTPPQPPVAGSSTDTNPPQP